MEIRPGVRPWPVLFLLLVITAIVLGILGGALKGLFYLLIIGAIVLIAGLLYAGA
jgi:hypothetical protein